MKPSTNILELGGTFRYEVYRGGKRFVSEPYTCKASAELALDRHLLKLPDIRRNPRMEQLLEDFGTACCRMAYKLTYCCGTPLQEVAEALGLTEDEAEQASEAGHHTLRELSPHGKAGKEQVREWIDSYFEKGYDDE